MPQKQYAFPTRNDLMSRFSLEAHSLEPYFVIKTMMNILKTKSKDSMDIETQMQFSKIADAVVQMAKEIRA